MESHNNPPNGVINEAWGDFVLSENSLQRLKRSVYTCCYSSYCCCCCCLSDFDFAAASPCPLTLLRFMSNINQPSLLTPFFSFLFLFCSCIYFCLNGPFSCKFFWQLSVFCLCSSGLISVLLVLPATYLFMKVSFGPYIIPSGWLGSIS